MPYYSYADGWATVRVYRHDEFLGSIRSDVRLHYSRNVYNERSNKQKAVVLARGMALRDAADKLAAQLCEQGGSVFLQQPEAFPFE